MSKRVYAARRQGPRREGTAKVRASRRTASHSSRPSIQRRWLGHRSLCSSSTLCLSMEKGNRKYVCRWRIPGAMALIIADTGPVAESARIDYFSTRTRRRQRHSKCDVVRGVVVSAAAALGAGVDTTQLLKGVETRYNRARTVQVLFEQTYTVQGRPNRTESGELSLRKPGRMRWQYESPKGKLFLSRRQADLPLYPGFEPR